MNSGISPFKKLNPKSLYIYLIKLKIIFIIYDYISYIVF